MKLFRSSAGTIAAMLLATVFAVTMFLSMVCGASVYRNVADRAEQASKERIGISYMITKIRSFDEGGMVHTGEFGDSDAVFLVQEFDGVRFHTILYVYDGWLRELFCEEDNELPPSGGEMISEAGGLSARMTENGFLSLGYTGTDGDVRTAMVQLRTSEKER